MKPATAPIPASFRAPCSSHAARGTVRLACRSGAPRLWVATVVRHSVSLSRRSRFAHPTARSRLDHVISNSPLTISRSNVRGIYLRQGPWQVNAGYSFFSTFENLLLPTNKEGVVGVAYRYQLSPRSSLTPNLFVFDGQPQPGRSGPVGTLFYEAQPATGVKFSAELGVSRSLGGAVEMEVDRPNRRAWAKLRVAPPELPSLTTDQQSGRQFEGGGIWQGDKTALNANISSRRYVQGTLGHTTSVASLT